MANVERPSPAPTPPRGETVDITPSPKILKVLGEIEFDPWQCIAELVDNSFDEFLDIKRSQQVWDEQYVATISLPPPAATDGRIEVRDNGRGMDLEMVRDAVRAGWSSNDPFSKLGLFGMGFNVATARLGARTRFLTTRSGDVEWVGVEVDLDRLEAGGDFAAPVVRETKGSLGEHGTRVEISRLYQRSDWLRRPPNQTRLRDILGRVYSYLLESEDFRLAVNGVRVKPIRHCVWDATRSVTRSKEVIPAVIEIDEHLGERAVCHSCQLWQDPANRSCDSCGSERLEVRDRRVWGWLGIQRYLDQKEFGIDFLRNGRKILRFDKGLFQWRDPDDPTGQGDTEYPVELPGNMGRIIGEVHLDHVPVNYTKDAFATSDSGWRHAVRVIRGEGPLLPKRAKEMGYAPNDSPLARLHRGFRRNDPGASYLTPGNGKTLIDTREWGRHFQKGEPDYQSDQKWWDAVKRHDEIVARQKRAREQAEAQGARELEDPTHEFRDGGSLDGVGAGEPEPPPGPKTERERVQALLARAEPMPELDGLLSVAGVAGRPVKLTAYEVRGAPVAGPDGKRAPVWLAPAVGGGFAAFVDIDHPLFLQFDDDPADLALMETAAHMVARAEGSAPTISVVFAALKERYLRSRSIDQATLRAEAAQIMQGLKERMVDCVADNPERPWVNCLTEGERDTTGDRIIQALRTANVHAVVADGAYMPFVPDEVVPRIVEDWPEAFFDDRLFSAPLGDVTSSIARRQTVATVTGYLNDVAWLAQLPQIGSRDRFIRARLSLQLLPGEVSEAKEDT